METVLRHRAPGGVENLDRIIDRGSERIQKSYPRLIRAAAARGHLMCDEREEEMLARHRVDGRGDCRLVNPVIIAVSRESLNPGLVALRDDVARRERA